MPVSVRTSVMIVQRAVISYVPPRNTRESGTARRVVRISVIRIVSSPSSPSLHAPFAQQTAIAGHIEHTQQQTHGAHEVDDLRAGGPGEVVPGDATVADHLAHPLEDIGAGDRPSHLLHRF